MIQAGMVQIVAPYFLIGSVVITYLLELWTGFAVVGWQGQNAMIDRREKPGPYWFAMVLQTAILIVIPVLIGMFQ